MQVLSIKLTQALDKGALYHRPYLLLLFCMLFYQGLSSVHLVVPVHRLCLFCSSCLWHQAANSEPTLRLCMHQKQSSLCCLPLRFVLQPHPRSSRPGLQCSSRYSPAHLGRRGFYAETRARLLQAQQLLGRRVRPGAGILPDSGHVLLRESCLHTTRCVRHPSAQQHPHDSIQLLQRPCSCCLGRACTHLAVSRGT